MAVEQTTQLIQLILNSVLMVNACAFILAGLLSRQSAASDRMQAASREFSASLDVSPLARSATAPKEPRQFQLRKQLRQFQQRYRSASNSVLAINYALLIFVGSTFLLVLRTLFNQNWLIPGSLGLFSIGVGVLLLGIVLTVYDLHIAERSLWQEVKDLLSGNKTGNEPKGGVRLQRPKSQETSQTPPNKSQLRPKAKVG